MKRIIFAALGGFALLTSAASAPAYAQEVQSETLSAEEARQLGDLFGDMFGTADPLSAEEEERLPAAMSVVTKLFPKGTYARMMDETVAPMMEAMLGDMGGNPALRVAQLTGLDPFDLTDLDEDRLTKAMGLLDPAASERGSEMAETMLTLIGDVMLDIEPAYRAGLARAYAVRFTNAELMDLDAYFETEVGKKYAAESFLVFADPQVISSMNEVMPAMMERMPEIMTVSAAIEENYAAARGYSSLSDAEQAQLAQFLGVSREVLAGNEPQPVVTEPAS